MRKSILTILCVLSSVSAMMGENFNSVLLSARRGRASAMNQLGVWYYTGNNVEKDYDKAYYWWSRGALARNPKAMANLGVCYQFGRGVARDSMEAVRLYVSAIAAGQDELLKQRMANTSTNAFDAMLSGYCLEKGVGTMQDMGQAAECYASAAALGSADGMLRAGEAFLAISDPARAFSYLSDAAARGDSRARYLAGKMLMGSMGVAADKPKAVELLRKAAQDGDGGAQNMLGMMSLKGDGVYADRREAMKWLKMSARAGEADGMWNYATALAADGELDEALFWYANAAQAGCLDDFKAMVNALPSDSPLGNYLRGMMDYKVKGDYEGADEWFRKVEKAGSADGKVMRAVVLADSRNPRRNPAKAAKTLEQMAGDSPHAATELAALLLGGNGVARNNAKALSLLRSASDADYGRAADMLADMYFTGTGTNTDRQGAAVLYKKALAARTLSEQGRRRLLAMRGEGMAIDSPTARAIEAYIPADNIIPLLKGQY